MSKTAIPTFDTLVECEHGFSVMISEEHSGSLYHYFGKMKSGYLCGLCGCSVKEEIDDRYSNVRPMRPGTC